MIQPLADEGHAPQAPGRLRECGGLLGREMAPRQTAQLRQDLGERRRRSAGISASISGFEVRLEAGEERELPIETGALGSCLRLPESVEHGPRVLQRSHPNERPRKGEAARRIGRARRRRASRPFDLRPRVGEQAPGIVPHRGRHRLEEKGQTSLVPPLGEEEASQIPGDGDRMRAGREGALVEPDGRAPVTAHVRQETRQRVVLRAGATRRRSPERPGGEPSHDLRVGVPPDRLGQTARVLLRLRHHAHRRQEAGCGVLRLPRAPRRLGSHAARTGVASVPGQGRRRLPLGQREAPIRQGCARDHQVRLDLEKPDAASAEASGRPHRRLAVPEEVVEVRLGQRHPRAAPRPRAEPRQRRGGILRQALEQCHPEGTALEGAGPGARFARIRTLGQDAREEPGALRLGLREGIVGPQPRQGPRRVPARSRRLASRTLEGIGRTAAAAALEFAFAFAFAPGRGATDRTEQPPPPRPRGPRRPPGPPPAAGTRASRVPGPWAHDLDSSSPRSLAPPRAPTDFRDNSLTQFPCVRLAYG